MRPCKKTNLIAFSLIIFAALVIMYSEYYNGLVFFSASTIVTVASFYLIDELIPLRRQKYIVLVFLRFKISSERYNKFKKLLYFVKAILILLFFREVRSNESVKEDEVLIVFSTRKLSTTSRLIIGAGGFRKGWYFREQIKLIENENYQ